MAEKSHNYNHVIFIIFRDRCIKVSDVYVSFSPLNRYLGRQYIYYFNDSICALKITHDVFIRNTGRIPFDILRK